MVSGECQGEMLDYRRMLMEDFSLSPEIVLHCRGEIETHCAGLHRKGRTLHCLMKVGRGDRSSTVESPCQNAVRILPLHYPPKNILTNRRSMKNTSHTLWSR